MKRQNARKEFLDSLVFPTGSPLEVYDGAYHESRAALLRDFERLYLGRLLVSAQGNIAKAARKAGIQRRYLYELLEKNGFRKGRGSAPPPPIAVAYGSNERMAAVTSTSDEPNTSLSPAASMT